MDNDVQELEHLVQEMLDYLRTDSTVPELNISELPLQALCEQTLQRLQVRNTRHIDVTVNAGAVKILGDGDYVERAVENLLVNAFRFAHSRIVIDAEIYRQKIRLSVHDDGPGISQENLQKVFAPFFRPDADRSRERGGAGLGLAIVKRIQHWHQGNCYAERSMLGGAGLCWNTLTPNDCPAANKKGPFFRSFCHQHTECGIYSFSRTILAPSALSFSSMRS